MIIITKRKKVGYIAGHFVYTMTDIEYITVTHKVRTRQSTRCSLAFFHMCAYVAFFLSFFLSFTGVA